MPLWRDLGVADTDLGVVDTDLGELEAEEDVSLLRFLLHLKEKYT